MIPDHISSVAYHSLFGCVQMMALVVKVPPANAEDLKDVGSISGSGRPPGGGYGHPLQYSCLKNHMDREEWWATVHRVVKSQA